MHHARSRHRFLAFRGGGRFLSLRVKFTLSLLLTSFISIACIGLVAHWMLFREFGQNRLDEAYLRFRNDVADYVITYGSWKKATEAEVFGEFSRRRNGSPPLVEDRSPLEILSGWLGLRETPREAPSAWGGPPHGIACRLLTERRLHFLRMVPASAERPDGSNLLPAATHTVAAPRSGNPNCTGDPRRRLPPFASCYSMRRGKCSPATIGTR